MKRILFTAVAVVGMTGAANAACDPGQYEFVTDYTVTPPATACVNVYNVGHRGSPAVTGQVGDTTGHGKRKGSEVHGVDGVALGSAAIVGGWTPPVSASCTVQGGESLPAWDGKEASCSDAQGTFTAGKPGVASPVAGGTAIGANASVQHDHSTALGADSKSTTDHQVVLGTSDDTVTAPGITSQKSKDRQSGPVEVVTTDASGNLASDGGRIDRTLGDHAGQLDDHNTRINKVQSQANDTDTVVAGHGARLDGHDDTLKQHDERITSNKKQADATDNRLNGFNGTGGTIETWSTGVDASLASHGGAISDLYGITGQQGLQIAGLYDITSTHTAQIADLQHDMKKVKGGVALALALDVPHLETGKRFGVAVNLADFEGTGAFAGGVALRLDQNWQVNAGGGLGFNGGAAGGKVGLVGQW